MNIETNSEIPLGVAFISTFSNKHGGVVSESLGPEALAGDLIGEFGDSVDVSHHDLQLDSMSTIRENIARSMAPIVGLSVKIGALEQLDDAVQEIRQLPYEPTIVLGGVVPTFAAEQLLQRYPDALVAIGESEMTMRGLVRHARGQQDLTTVPGLARLEGGRMIKTPPERIDLSTLRLPARITTSRVHNELKGLVWFEGSRGCDWHCTFCSRRALRGDGFSGDISTAHVVDDLENLTKLGIESVHATDDDWGGDPERTLAIADDIIGRGLNIKWSMSTRADHIWKATGPNDNPVFIEAENKRLRYIMQRQMTAGLDRVFLGLESFSPSQLKRYGKQISVEANYRAVEVLQDLGVDVVAGYIPIDPLMSLDELQENLVGLRNTGMYKKVTNPLSVLRVQEGSPYLKMVQSRSRIDGIDYLGERSEDLVFYDVKNYKDPCVQIVADLADKWVSDMYPIIFGLKMEVFATTQDLRINDQQAHWCEATLHGFRELEMEFIESVTQHLLRGGRVDNELKGITDRFEHVRNMMVRRAQDEMHVLGIKFNDAAIAELLSGEAARD